MTSKQMSKLVGFVSYLSAIGALNEGAYEVKVRV